MSKSSRASKDYHEKTRQRKQKAKTLLARIECIRKTKNGPVYGIFATKRDTVMSRSAATIRTNKKQNRPTVWKFGWFSERHILIINLNNNK